MADWHRRVDKLVRAQEKQHREAMKIAAKQRREAEERKRQQQLQAEKERRLEWGRTFSCAYCRKPSAGEYIERVYLGHVNEEPTYEFHSTGRPADLMHCQCDSTRWLCAAHLYKGFCPYCAPKR